MLHPLFYRNKVVTIHDIAVLKNPAWFSRTYYLYYRFMIPRIVKDSTKILTVSNFSRREISEVLNIPANRIEVIYNAVDGRFYHDPGIKKEKYILTVSSIDPRKNLKNLILALKKLNLPAYRLMIAGAESKIFSNTKLKELIESTPHVEFTGHVNDRKLVELYQKTTVFVFLSFYEGFGLPPLEAMACGTPAIVSRATSLPEAVRMLLMM